MPQAGLLNELERCWHEEAPTAESRQGHSQETNADGLPRPFLHPVALQLLEFATSGRCVASISGRGASLKARADSRHAPADGWRLLEVVLEIEREEKRTQGHGLELLEAILSCGVHLGTVRGVASLSNGMRMWLLDNECYVVLLVIAHLCL